MLFNLIKKSKKILPYVLILTVLATAILGPFPFEAKKAEAAFFIPFLLYAGITAAIGYFVYSKQITIAIDIMAWFLNDVVKLIASYIMAGAGLLLDHVIDFTINYNIGDLDAVKIGWKVTRDIANLFFIFILLFIAIATILQLSTYGMKALLVRLIIIVLLVNFSFIITKIIIDASNLLALAFRGAMSIPGGSISQTIISGLDLLKLYELPAAAGIDKMKVIEVAFFSTIFFLVTAYVFFMGVFLFIVRFIVFLFLLILAPVAFIAMILPETRSISKKWWDTLFKQALVAPAYLFLIYIVVMIINNGVLINVVTVASPDPDLSAPLLLNFLILIGLMYGSVKVAKEVGGQLSAQALSWAGKAGTLALGVAGGAALVGARHAKRGAGYVAEKSLDEKSWINRKTKGTVRKVAEAPLVGRGFAKVSSLRQQEMVKKSKQYEKQYSSYSNAGLSTVLKDPFMSKSKKEAIKKIQAQRGKTEREKEELGKLERHLPKMQILRPGLKQKISQIDSDIENILTDITTAEYKLAEAVKQGNTAAITLVKDELNTAKKQKAQKLIEKYKATGSLEKIEKHESRKERLEEKKERKGETAGLQSSISSIKAGGGGKSTP